MYEQDFLNEQESTYTDLQDIDAGNIWTNYLNRRYDADYFSSAQTQMYIGDILIDDCARISYNAVERVRPVYGCNSRYWDTVVGGQVLIEGRFAINFKEKAYIPIILEYVKNKKTPPVLSGGTGYQNRTGKGNTNKSLNIEQAKKLIGLGREAEAEDLLFTSLHWTDDKLFENEAESLENRLWKSDGGSGSQNDYHILDRPLVPVPFDIYILYGDYSTQATDMANHTAIKLESCVIVGESQIIEIGGQPIIEVYDFIGRRKK